MAKEDTVDTILRKLKEYGSYYKDYGRNVAGGAYSTVAGMLSLPVQAASVGLQAAKGTSFKDIQIPQPFEGAKKAFTETTGIPTKAEKGQELAFGFGRGAVGSLNPAVALAGGAASAVSEKYIPEDQVGLKLMLEFGVPVGASIIQGTTKAIRSGSLRDMGKPTDAEIPMGKGNLTGKGRLLAEQEYLKTHPKAADTVAAIQRGFADKSKQVLERFTDRLEGADRKAGERAYAGWKKFVDSKESELFAKSKPKFDRAYAAGGNKPIVDVGLVNRTIDDLVAKYSPLTSEEAQATVKQLLAMKQSLAGTKLTLQDANSRLEEIGRLGNAGKGGSASIGIGTDTHVMRELGKAWRESLGLSANQVDGAGKLSEDAQAVRKLIEARAHYGIGAEDVRVLKDSATNTFMEVGQTGERKLMQPEAIMAKIRAMKPAERDFFVTGLEQADPGAVDALRKNILNNIVDKGNVFGADSRLPSFSNELVLRELDKRGDDLRFLLPSSTQREQFEKTVSELRQSIQRSGINREGMSPALSEASGMASLATGKPGAGAVTRGVVAQVADLFSNKEALAKRLFGSQGQPETVAGRVANTIKEGVSENAAFNLNRAATGAGIAGNALGSPEKPAVAPVTDELPDPPEGFWEDLPEPPKGFWDDAPKEPTQSPKSGSNPAAEKLLDAIKQVESNGNANAVGPQTKYGTAKGAYQFLDSTAKQYGLDDKTVFDEPKAREAAKKHMNYLLKKFDGDVTKAVAAYNWGEGNLDKNGLDKLPTETRNYVGKVHNLILND